MRAVQARGLSQAQGAGLQVSSRSHWSHTRIAIATDLGSGLATHMDRKGHGPEQPATQTISPQPGKPWVSPCVVSEGPHPAQHDAPGASSSPKLSLATAGR